MEMTSAQLNIETALAACRGDAALARALIAQYRAGLPAERAKLADALAAAPPDWEAVRERAHRLQSGGAYLGAEQIALAAQELETGILAQNSTATLMAAWQTLERAFDEFSAAPIEDWEKRPGVVNRPSGGVVP